MSSSFEELVESYREKLPGRIEQLKSNYLKSIEINDAELKDLAINEAHKLKGSGGIYGFAEISEGFAKIEKLMKEDYTNQVEVAILIDEYLKIAKSLS